MKGFFAPSTYWNKQAHEPFGMHGAGHIIIIVLLISAIALIIIFRNKIKHDFIKRFLFVMCFVWGGLEILKIVLFWVQSNDTRQALREVLPLYMCSLYLFMLVLAVFANGRLKEIGECTLVTLCMLSGILTVINCPVLMNYPFWSFFSLHSLLYHAFMAVTGMLLLASGYVQPNLKKFYYPIFPIIIIAIPAIILNYAVDTDYMLLRYAWGTPILSDIAKAIGEVMQIFFMLFVYSLTSFIMTALGKLATAGKTNK